MIGTLWIGNQLSFITSSIIHDVMKEISTETSTKITTCSEVLASSLDEPPPPEEKRIIVDSRQDLVIYKVSGNQIADPELLTVAENLKPLQEDEVLQKRIWYYFSNIIPLEQRKDINKYTIFTDGTGNYTAAIYHILDWKQNAIIENSTLEVDLADFTDEKQFTPTLVHEFGHMVTLNTSQINYELDKADCPRYFRDPGCSQPSSYLQLFYEHFWKGATYEKWQAIAHESDPAIVESGLKKFYQAYPQDFVNEYAATKIEEDIAESWTIFVLSPKLSGNIPLEQKVNFFYEFPELVQTRSDIRNRICSHFNLKSDQ
jgi:hypothetical protein